MVAKKAPTRASSVYIDQLRPLIDKEKSRQVVADGTGIDKGTVTKHYNRELNVNADQMVKYCNFFGVSADFLLGRTKVETTDPTIREICEYTGLSEKAVKALHKKKTALDEYNEKTQATVYRERIAEMEREKTLQEEIEIEERDTRNDFFDFLNYIIETDARFLYTSMINPQLDNKTLNLNMLCNGLEQFAADPRLIKANADNAGIYYQRGKDIVKDTHDYFQRLLFICCEDFKRAVNNYSRDAYKEMGESWKRCKNAVLAFEKTTKGDKTNGIL